MKVLVTGAAGFIGSATSHVLLAQGDEVIGVDNLNAYYDPKLKQARLERLLGKPNFSFQKMELSEWETVRALFEKHRPDKVIHLAAQAGVRYSLENPFAYLNSNIAATMNILEACRAFPVKHLVYASSSSVYGASGKQPFSELNSVDHPVSLYAATKKSTELIAHSYSHLFKIPTSGLRFFTVYGPWGRPDMSIFLFTDRILKGQPIDVFNHGQHRRDFTFVDDIVNGVVRLLDVVPQGDPTWDPMNPDPSRSRAPYRIYNIGNNSPVDLEDMISILETKLGKKAIKNYLPMQQGDVLATYADTSALKEATGFAPSTALETGIGKFVDWYRDFYRV